MIYLETEMRVSVPKIAILFGVQLHVLKYLLKKHNIRRQAFVPLNDEDLDELVGDLVQLYPNAGSVSLVYIFACSFSKAGYF